MRAVRDFLRLGARATERFGKYELLCQLATGGMAEIHLARARGLRGFEKLVVLKRMLPQTASSPELVRMFLDEARLVATLDHPHITHVHDVGRARGRYFFTMEYVHGEDLGAILAETGRQRAPIPLEHAVAIVAQAAAGLHHAHKKTDQEGRPLTIVHRDVTPSNVLVSYDGAVKVSDFGVAKWAAQRTETQHGTLKGKFPYMSPEQARGDPLDPRSDVFALGILLYELVTGSRLYQGTSDFAILTRIVQEDAPPPSRLRPDCPPALEAIVLRALSRTREARFATAEELQLALEELARRERWSLSSVGLARYMQGLFGGKLDAWHRARDAGKTLGQHIVECTQADAPLARARTSSSMGARFGLRRRPRLWLAFSLAGCAVLGLGAYAATQLGPRADQMPRPRQTLVTLPPVETPPTQPAEKPVIAEATATPERRPLSPARPKRVVRRPPARTENPSHPDQVKLSTGKTWNPDALLPP